MNRDRPGRRSHLRSIEVMNVTQIGQRAGGETDRSTAEIARLFDVAGWEDEAIRLADASMSRRREVKAALKRLSSCGLRPVLEFRRQALGGEPA
jgi:hypothetical protein